MSLAGTTRTARQRRTRSRVTAAAAAAGLVLLAASCGSSDAGADEAAGDVEVTMVDFAYVDLPASVPAGTRLSVVNDADAELHELVAFRLPDGEARPVTELVGRPMDELGGVLGPPVAVLLAAPRDEQVAAVSDGTLTDTGRYAILCFIPTGADPAGYLAAAATSDGPPEVPGGPPHLVYGMVAELVVE